MPRVVEPPSAEKRERDRPPNTLWRPIFGFLATQDHLELPRAEPIGFPQASV